MKKFSLDTIDDVLFMIDVECPNLMYEELNGFQSDCEIFENCFDCWYRTVTKYKYEESLKCGNDESEDK